MILAVFRRRRYCVKALPLRCNRIAVTVQSHHPCSMRAHCTRCNRIAVTVQSHRRYGAIASPLRCNRDAVTVQSRRDYTVTAKLFGRKHAVKAASSVFPALNGPVPKC